MFTALAVLFADGGRFCLEQKEFDPQFTCAAFDRRHAGVVPSVPRPHPYDTAPHRSCHGMPMQMQMQMFFMPVHFPRNLLVSQSTPRP